MKVLFIMFIIIRMRSVLVPRFQAHKLTSFITTVITHTHTHTHTTHTTHTNLCLTPFIRYDKQQNYNVISGTRIIAGMETNPAIAFGCVYILRHFGCENLRLSKCYPYISLMEHP